MKNLTLRLFALTAAIVACASCSKDNEMDLVRPAEKEGIVITVKASEVKTYLDTYNNQDKVVLWGSGEQMMLCISGGSSDTFAKSSVTDSYAGSPDASFSFSVNPASASSYLYQGIYPATAAVEADNTDPDSFKVLLPEVQNASSSSYDPAAFIMIAHPDSFNSLSTEWTASFRRAVALNKITLKGIPSGKSVKRVEIIAPAGVNLAGAREMNLSTGESGSIYSGSRSLDVKYATPLSGGGDIDVWFTSWEASIGAGESLSVIAYTSDSYSYTKEITIPDGHPVSFREGCLNSISVNMSGITPVLYYFNGGKGNSTSPWRIETMADLAEMAAKVEAGSGSFRTDYYRQSADIDFDGGYMDAIGNSNSADYGGPEANYFEGTYLGGGYSIKNAVIRNQNDRMAVGFFGYLAGQAHVDGLRMVNVSTSATGHWNVGSVVGCIQPSSTAVVENCVVSGSEISTTKESVGGICGKQMSGTIRACSFKGIVRGDYAVGGIVGYHNAGNTYSCTVTGSQTSIEGAKYDVGGIVGQVHNNSEARRIENCVVDCKEIVGTQGKLGGIVGSMEAPIVINACSAKCDIINNSASGTYGFLGGIVGYIYNNQKTMLISNCCFVGGSILNYNGTGGGVAGIVGKADCRAMNYFTIFNSCAFPTKISTASGSNTNIAGIVGFAQDVTIRNCYSPAPYTNFYLDNSSVVSPASNQSNGSIYGWLRGSGDSGTVGAIISDVYWISGFKAGRSSGSYSYTKSEQELSDAQMRGNGSVTRPSTSTSYSNFISALDAAAAEWNENPQQDVHAASWELFTNGYPVPRGTASPSSGSDPVPLSGLNLLSLCDTKISEYGRAAVPANHVYICSHRGNTYWSVKNKYPENSIPAIQKAIALGLDMVEIDVRQTADGRLMLMHNEGVKYTTNASGSPLISEMSYDEVRALRLRARGSSTYLQMNGDYIRVPSLEEALAVCKGKIFVILDIKKDGNDNEPDMDAVIEAIRTTDTRDQVLIFGVSDKRAYVREGFDTLGGMLAIHPWITAPSGITDYSSGYFGTTKLFQYDYKTYYDKTTEGFGELCHSYGALSLSNCIDDPNTGGYALGEQLLYWYDDMSADPDTDCDVLERFIEAGSDFIQTDYYEIVDEYLKNKNLR
ncbi:MAG: glycerophosphodiester phosphodiesterase family protein [Bacteroidales bacterium]|nr:glycerophosphodiester phosphodiesterase family protein [Bacteroidales bacterium]